MIILGIETSCDETAAAVLSFDSAQDGKYRIQILSNVVASSAKLQEKFGGIIPEQAAREQIKSIIPVIEESLQVSGYSGQEIDAIAVTYGPGLIGSLLVGVETAKTLAKVWNKPLIPINHLIGHFYANWINQSSAISYQLSDKKQKRSDDSVPTFPCLGLLVSGGHTDLVLFTDHGKYQYLGGTRDDAAGECFDKCARLLKLPYPGGPNLSKLAEVGNPKAFDLPRPMIKSKDLDFSFSGLKTAVANLIQTSPVILSAAKNLLPASPSLGGRMRDPNKLGDPSSTSSPQDDKVLSDLAASIEAAIVDVLVDKTLKAAKKHGVKTIIVAGGVAANQRLVNRLQVTGDSLGIKLHVPPSELCTDNGAMIASAGFFYKKTDNIFSIEADPNLSL